ncbi:MAG: oligopeptide transporter, OPT family [Steroidobacteraceae bacterium]|nr:oligopeptide transporter, OPT family [Steroidobacteraceae bacterium]
MHGSTLAPQLTLRAIVLAIILAMILAAANTYLGLFAGMTIASAIPAAVISMAVLKLLGGGGILENNIVATGASAGSSIASGVIFTIPALVILGFWTDFLSQYWWVLAIAGLGGLLGVLFSVPLRRSLVVEQKMAFPEGKAAAEVLKTGENPAEGLRILGWAALGGALGKLGAASGLRLFPDTAAAATYSGKTIAFFGTNLSPALLGVGYIVGLNVGTLVLLGGMLSWNLAIPIYSTFFLDGNPALATTLQGLSAEDAAYAIWSKEIRYLGVGAMLVGGLWALISLRHSILSGVRSGLAVARAGAGAGTVPHTDQDLPMKWVLIGIVLFTLPLWWLYQNIVGSLVVSVPMTVIMVVAGFLFCSVSAYMAGLVGSSNNPVSGITICTILFAALVLLVLMGPNAELGPVAAIMIGAVVCCAACISGDNLQDLKCGYIVGATPWRQQVMLGVGAATSALVMAPVLYLLDSAYGIGGVPTAEHPSPLLAPQATLMASVAKGIFGGALPWTTIGIGALIGVAIIVWDVILKNRGAKFRAPVLAVAVGIYLPLELSVPIFIGGVLSYLVARSFGADKSEEEIERLHRKGMLFAAGMITGEALLGIVIAAAIVIRERPDALALPAAWQFGGWLGLLLLAFLAAALYRTARQPT